MEDSRNSSLEVDLHRKASRVVASAPGVHRVSGTVCCDAGGLQSESAVGFPPLPNSGSKGGASPRSEASEKAAARIREALPLSPHGGGSRQRQTAASLSAGGLDNSAAASACLLRSDWLPAAESSPSATRRQRPPVDEWPEFPGGESRENSAAPFACRHSGAAVFDGSASSLSSQRLHHSPLPQAMPLSFNSGVRWSWGGGSGVSALRESSNEHESRRLSVAVAGRSLNPLSGGAEGLAGAAAASSALTLRERPAPAAAAAAGPLLSGSESQLLSGAPAAGARCSVPRKLQGGGASTSVGGNALCPFADEKKNERGASDGDIFLPPASRVLCGGGPAFSALLHASPASGPFAARSALYHQHHLHLPHQQQQSVSAGASAVPPPPLSSGTEAAAASMQQAISRTAPSSQQQQSPPQQLSVAQRSRGPLFFVPREEWMRKLPAVAAAAASLGGLVVAGSSSGGARVLSSETLLTAGAAATSAAPPPPGSKGESASVCGGGVVVVAGGGEAVATPGSAAALAQRTASSVVSALGGGAARGEGVEGAGALLSGEEGEAACCAAGGPCLHSVSLLALPQLGCSVELFTGGPSEECEAFATPPPFESRAEEGDPRSSGGGQGLAAESGAGVGPSSGNNKAAAGAAAAGAPTQTQTQTAPTSSGCCWRVHLKTAVCGCVLAGSGVLRMVEGEKEQRLPLRPGTVFCIPPLNPHLFVGDEGSPLLIFAAFSPPLSQQHSLTQQSDAIRCAATSGRFLRGDSKRDAQLS